MTKQDRAAEANRVIEAIARHGRRFFYSDTNDRISRFEVDQRGRVWLIDKYSGHRVYTHYQYRWRGFTEGGTLKALCEALRDYIRNGKPISRRYFGPWPEHYCDGDLWGYGHEAMEALRADLAGSPAVATP